MVPPLSAWVPATVAAFYHLLLPVLRWLFLSICQQGTIVSGSSIGFWILGGNTFATKQSFWDFSLPLPGASCPGELVISMLINHCLAKFWMIGYFWRPITTFKPLCNSDFSVSKAFFSLSVVVASLRVSVFACSRLSYSLALNLNCNSLPHFLKV